MNMGPGLNLIVPSVIQLYGFCISKFPPKRWGKGRTRIPNCYSDSLKIIHFGDSNFSISQIETQTFFPLAELMC